MVRRACKTRSSKPGRSPKAIAPAIALMIVELRRKLFLQARIASYLGVSKATVSRVLRRAGLSRLSDLAPIEPVQRYECEAPGEPLHIDIKKLGRFSAVGHRITGDYTKRTRGLGWEYLFVAVDDHARIAFTAIHPDERQESALAVSVRPFHVRPFHLDGVAVIGHRGQVVEVSGRQRYGSNSSMRLAGCVGKRSSTSFR